MVFFYAFGLSKPGSSVDLAVARGFFLIMWQSSRMQVERATARPKPRLRGVSHLIAAIAALPASVILFMHAADEVAWSAAVYGASVLGLLSSSALYHTPHWTPEKRMRLRRLDRSMIYILIAGSYTPFCVELGGEPASVLLKIVWAAAMLGVVKSVAWTTAPRLITALPYVLLGWAVVPYASDFYDALGQKVSWLIVAGGVLYTLGAVAYARKSPDPFPATFGYHEIFHLLVICALCCHYSAIWLFIGT